MMSLYLTIIVFCIVVDHFYSASPSIVHSKVFPMWETLRKRVRFEVRERWRNATGLLADKKLSSNSLMSGLKFGVSGVNGVVSHIQFSEVERPYLSVICW